MPLSPKDIAEAFSRHRFDEAIPYLADDVTWSLVGEERIDGREAVVAICDSTSAELRDTTTVFTRFSTVLGQNSVVVDSVAEFTDAAGGKSVVASCDLFHFGDGRLTEIRSYNIELE